MGLLLLVVLIADAVILVASFLRPQAWALAVCRATIDLCDFQVALIVVGVVLGGIFFIQR